MLKTFLTPLVRTHMDIVVRAGDGMEARIIERPGRWMTPDALARLTDDLRQVAATTLPAGDLTYGVFTGDPERLENTIITLVRRKSDGRPVAFNCLALMEVDIGGDPMSVLHLGLVMVDPNERSQGLSWVLYGLTCMLLLFRNQLRPLWVSNVTQVPAIVGMVSETFDQVYPTPDPARHRSLKHLLIARQIMRHHRHVFGVGAEAGFDEARFVITNAYTGGSDALKKTFDEAPKHRDAIYNDFCAEQLDYVRGDDVLQLGQINLPATRGYLRDTVPRASLANVAMTVGFVTLQRLLLPIVHWLDSGKDWGILRKLP